MGEVAPGGAGRPGKKRVFALVHKSRGGDIVDRRTVHLLIEIKIKAIARGGARRYVGPTVRCGVQRGGLACVAVRP